MIEYSAILEYLRGLKSSNNITQLKIELNNLHPADLAEIFNELQTEERKEFFNLLTDQEAAQLLEKLSPQIQVDLLSIISEEKAANIIMNMPHDSVADFLGDLSDKETESYLVKLPARVSSQIRELLSYKEDTAGGIMNSQFLAVEEDMTVDEALDYLRIKAKNGYDFYYLYVTDKDNYLLGIVSLRNLITSPSSTKTRDIMTKDIIKVNVFDDQDEVADTLIKYELLALPVVDDYGKIKGIVTWDDAQEVSKEETTEEIYASSGISTDVIDENEILLGHIFKAVRARTPWLMVTLIGEFFAVNVANHFDSTLTALPIIAIFMPLLAGLGGNIGTQTSTIIVRGLSTGQISLHSALSLTLREARVGLIVGFFFGVIVALITWSWKGNIFLGLVVGLTMVTNMTIATLIGSFTPFVLKRLNVDPAIASGPFIATIIDVLGLAVYFSLVTLAIGILK